MLAVSLRAPYPQLVRITLATIRDSAPRNSPLAALTRDYIERTNPFLPAEWTPLKTVPDLLALRAKPASVLLLLDSSGRQYGSVEFANLLGSIRDGGKRSALLAIGPADGWSPADLKSADHLISLGPMTLPHQLAAVVLAEQIYRAATILARHPYHMGH
jgi:23S rRNA (pseudouridine1915-N3)-methyltransferase